MKSRRLIETSNAAVMPGGRNMARFPAKLPKLCRQPSQRFTLTPHIPDDALPEDAKQRKLTLHSRSTPMLDRRQSARDRMILGSVAMINERGSTMDCVVRNMSKGGACVEFEQTAKLPDEMRVSIVQKNCSFFAKTIWRRGGRVGLAFRTMTAAGLPASTDLDERLLRSEKKKRQLQLRIKQLTGES
jgi:PilZ domain